MVVRNMLISVAQSAIFSAPSSAQSAEKKCWLIFPADCADEGAEKDADFTMLSYFVKLL